MLEAASQQALAHRNKGAVMYGRASLRSLVWVAGGSLILCGCGSSNAVSRPTSKEIRRVMAAQEARPMEPAPTFPALQLSGVLAAPTYGIRETAGDALARIGPETVPYLIRALQHRDPAVRQEAARVLARLGAAAEPALNELIAALEDPDEGVRRTAARALGQIGPAAQAAIGPLMQLITNPDAPVRSGGRAGSP